MENAVNERDSDELDGWLRLARVLAWSRSSEVIDMIGLRFSDIDRTRAVARVILERYFESDASQDWSDPRAASGSIADMLGVEAGESDAARLAGVVHQGFARPQADVNAADSWGRFLTAMTNRPSLETAQFEPVIEIARRTLAVDRLNDLPTADAGEEDPWDAGFQLDHHEQEPATFVWVARILRDYDEFWRRARNHLRDQSAIDGFLSWARGEARHLGLPYAVLSSPLTTHGVAGPIDDSPPM